MPAAGNRDNSNGSLNNRGSNGNYWSSTESSSNAQNLNFNSSDANMNTNNRTNGFSLRCVAAFTIDRTGTGYLVCPVLYLSYIVQ
jgi:uncharacterized protein (TIGR02145 family)